MEESKIEWTDNTFNPWIGCTKVSAGCKNCYAETLDNNRFSRTMDGGTKEIPVSHWGVGAPRHRTSEAMWKHPLAWNKTAEKAGKRTRVFCASLADVFDSEVPWMWRNDLFVLIEKTPHLDWQILTKRPENIMPMLRQIGEHWGLQVDVPGIRTGNVWLGTSVEDQDAADKRIPELLKVPAVVRFLSCEPLLGEVDLQAVSNSRMNLGEGQQWIDCLKGRAWEVHGPDYYDVCSIGTGIDWVIAGGESGPGARPMHPDWARSLRDQCAAANVPFLYKQWGEWIPRQQLSAGWSMPWKGGVPQYEAHIWDAKSQACDFSVRIGKHAAGRELDGATHDGYPDAALAQALGTEANNG